MATIFVILMIQFSIFRVQSVKDCPTKGMTPKNDRSLHLFGWNRVVTVFQIV